MYIQFFYIQIMFMIQLKEKIWNSSNLPTPNPELDSMSLPSPNNLIVFKTPS